MKLFLHSSTLIAALLLGSNAFAQAEVEPNNTKATATPIVGIVSGGVITGSSTGTGLGATDTSVTTADYFRVKTATLPAGIYQHVLTLTSGTSGHAPTIRGLNQAAGTPTAGTDAAFQTAVNVQNMWYGFGAQEELYYRVTGTAASTAAYGATLTTTTVTPVAIAGTFNPGPITVTTAGQGHATDTELYLYDGSFNPVPLGHKDDNIGGVAGPSTVSVVLSAGTYYVASGSYNMANDQGDANPAEAWLTGPLLDFPNALARDTINTGANVNVSFSVSDGATTTPVPAFMPSALNVVWGTFTVQVNTNPPANDGCANAQAIGSGTFGGVLTFATNDGAASCDPGGAASKDVWFSFTDTLGGGTLNLDTCGSTADTVLSVYAACGGTELGCSDTCGGTPCGGTSSCLTLVLNPSQTVKIRVSDKGLGGGNYVLHASLTLANDSCLNPAVISGPGIYPFDTTVATTGQGTTGACGGAPVKDLWYAYTATTNGTLTVTTCGQVTGTGSTDTEIWIYQGAGCPTVAAIACNDDACGLQTTVTTPVTCGTVYMLEVGNYDGQPTANMAGTFTVTESGSACATPSTAFCEGNTVGTTCVLCGNNGTAGRGCANSSFSSGALLTNTGIASTTADTLILLCSEMTGPGLFFQANGLAASPIGFGDGMLCATVGILRMGVVFPTAGVAAYPGGLTPNPISAFGAQPGDTKHYQCWYRDAIASFCPTATFNTSNGISLVWQ